MAANIFMSLQKSVRVSVLLILLLNLSSKTAAQDEHFAGYWATSNLTSVVEVSQCGDTLCAEIAWLWDISVAGRRMLDEKNSQSSRQTESLLDLQLFSRFKKEGETWKGRIYNPEDGRTYRASITSRSKNILRVRGCWGPFCLTQTWRRLQSINIPTEKELKLRKQ